MFEASADREKAHLAYGQGESFPAMDPKRTPLRRSTDPLERRAWPRFTALDPRGWVGWWAGGDFYEVEARLLDIGEFGAAVEVDRLLPRDCPLFLSLNNSSATESIEAEVVATQPGRRKKLLVRLAFASRCPSRLLAAIINGPTTLPTD